jgi:hypothetical protein
MIILSYFQQKLNGNLKKRNIYIYIFIYLEETKSIIEATIDEVGL